jgi:hypothetical protein
MAERTGIVVWGTPSMQPSPIVGSDGKAYPSVVLDLQCAISVEMSMAWSPVDGVFDKAITRATMVLDVEMPTAAENRSGRPQTVIRFDPNAPSDWFLERNSDGQLVVQPPVTPSSSSMSVEQQFDIGGSDDD